MNGCKYMFLCGGLSASKYYQDRMIQKFDTKSLKVITAANPLLSVAAGAAYFGIARNIPCYIDGQRFKRSKTLFENSNKVFEHQKQRGEQDF